MWETGAVVHRLPKGEGGRGGITSDQYVRLMKKWLPDILRRVRHEHATRPIYFMQDGASVHAPDRMREVCADLGVNFLEGWPAHSPDLNPIENFWALMKRAVGREVQLFQNNEGNRQIIEKKVKTFARRAERSLVKKLSRVGKRYAAVLENRGIPLGY